MTFIQATGGYHINVLWKNGKPAQNSAMAKLRKREAQGAACGRSLRASSRKISSRFKDEFTHLLTFYIKVFVGKAATQYCSNKPTNQNGLAHYLVITKLYERQ